MEVSTSDKQSVKDTSFIQKKEAKAVKNVLHWQKIRCRYGRTTYFVNKIVSELMNKKSIVMSEDKYKQKIKSMKAKEKIL